MKKHILIIISLISILSFSTCTEDFFDDVKNKNNPTVDNWYKTAADYQMALNSCYCPLMDGGMFGLQHHYLYATFSDRTLYESTGKDKININSTSDGINQAWRAQYFGLYRTCKLIEQLKANKGEIENMKQDQYDYSMAQAKALRGIYYFYLVTVFNKPIFYTDESVPVDYTENATNGAPEDFWTQLEIDLDEAIPGLMFKSELPQEEMGRITKGAAKAILAKALLYKHYYYYAKNGNAGSADDTKDLEKARDLFKEIIDSEEYSLVQPKAPKKRKDYIYALLSNSAFTNLQTEDNSYTSENNQESVWEVQYADGPVTNENPYLPGWMAPGSLNFQFFSGHQESFRNHGVHPNLYYEFETEGAPAPFDRDPRCYATFYFDGDTMDFRSASSYFNKQYKSLLHNKGIALARGLNVPTDAGWGGTNDLGIKKYYFPIWETGAGGDYAPENDPTNRRIIRYADVLLMYAEIMYILGDDGSGLNALNEVRKRVDMPEISALTPEAIIHERDVELAFEGHRWFDIVRWSFDSEWDIIDDIHWGIDADNTINPFVRGKHEYMPIPLYEIDLSEGNLKQNPGW